MKNPAAFISYARRDDAAYSRRITGLRQKLQGMVASAIGRDFEIFQDRQAIAWGQHWPTRLDEALEEALFLIPILTPSYFNSEACRAELETFLELERRSGRKDRVLSLYFLTAPVYEQKADPLAAVLHERQHRDWRHLRIDPLGSAKVMRALDSLAGELAAAIHARQHEVIRQTEGAAEKQTKNEAHERIENEVRRRPEKQQRQEAETGTRRKTVEYFRHRKSQLKAHDEVRPTEIENQPQQTARGGTAPKQDRPPSQKRGSSETGSVFRDVEAPWCPELVAIPNGSFVMGSPQTEEGRSPDEGPQHEVAFTRPFALARYPVTFEEYDHFCVETGRKKPRDQGWGRGRRPVMNVSWDDVKAYCAWLRGQTGQRYRLPSEAEWEYACRAGTTTPFWTGATISTQQANYDGNYTYGSGRKCDYRGHTTPVDTFEANPWGLHDMHGNVWEWCEDHWNDSYQGAPTDGSACLQGNRGTRVVRGGSWCDEPRSLRSANRFWSQPGYRLLYLGFRVSRTLLVGPASSPVSNTDWRNQRYHDTSLAGRVTFNYTNNDGLYSIGRDEFFFQIKWSKASGHSIHLLADSASISGIAEAPLLRSYAEVGDPGAYDMSSRVRTIQEGEHAILRNNYNNYAVVKVIDVKDRTRSDNVDELTFKFWILTHGT